MPGTLTHMHQHYTCIQPPPNACGHTTATHTTAGGTHLHVHTQGACTYLSPHSHSSQVSVPDKVPQALSFLFLGKRVTV